MLSVASVASARLCLKFIGETVGARHGASVGEHPRPWVVNRYALSRLSLRTATGQVFVAQNEDKREHNLHCCCTCSCPRSTVEDAVGTEVGDAAGANVGNSVGAEVGAAVGAEVGD